MVPIFPHRQAHRHRNDSTLDPDRAAKEQAFYDRHGSDSIVGFYRFIQTVSVLLGAPAMMLRWLSAGRLRQHRVALIRFGRKQPALFE